MLEFDVVVVGSGAAGSIVSTKLNASGLRVACFESGDQIASAELPASSAYWQARRNKDFAFSPNLRMRVGDLQVDDVSSPIAVSNFSALGGSTILFSGHYPRFRPSDFEARNREYVWPISYEDLEPHYDYVASLIPVAGLDGDPAYPPINGLLPPVELGKMGLRLAQILSSAGWHWWPSYSAIATRKFGAYERCENIGTCNLGCPAGAKGSVDRLWGTADTENISLFLRHRVTKVLVDGTRGVKGIEFVRDGSTEPQHAAARSVVLCAGAISTPAILLMSATKHYKNGLANSSGQVGRNLMLHPLAYVEGQFSENLESCLGPQGCVLYSHQFSDGTSNRAGYMIQALRGPWPLESANQLTDLRPGLRGAEFLDSFLARFNRTIHLAAVIEDEPCHNNTVQVEGGPLSPKIKVSYALSQRSKKALVHAVNTGRSLLHSAGALKTWGYGPVRHSGWHLMGTVRMGNDPRTSVVGPTGEAHDVERLYVADASVFVSSATVNPAATVQAIASRTAECVLKALTK